MRALLTTESKQRNLLTIETKISYTKLFVYDAAHKKFCLRDKPKCCTQNHLHAIECTQAT